MTDEIERRIAEIADKHISLHFGVDGSGSELSKSVQTAIKVALDDPLIRQSIADEAYKDTEADGVVFCGKCGHQK